MNTSVQAQVQCEGPLFSSGQRKTTHPEETVPEPSTCCFYFLPVFTVSLATGCCSSLVPGIPSSFGHAGISSHAQGGICRALNYNTKSHWMVSTKVQHSLKSLCEGRRNCCVKSHCVGSSRGEQRPADREEAESELTLPLVITDPPHGHDGLLPPHQHCSGETLSFHPSDATDMSHGTGGAAPAWHLVWAMRHEELQSCRGQQ